MQNFTKSNFWKLFDETFLSDVERAMKDIECRGCHAKSRNAFDGMARPLHFYPLVCAIDYLRYFKFGGDSKGAQYKQIVNQYLQSYDAEFLYSVFRCGLIHRLSISPAGKIYVFTDDVNSKIDTRKYHLKTIEIQIEQQGKIHVIIFNLKNFVDDVKKAAKSLIDEIFAEKDRNSDPYNRCAEWYHNFVLSKKGFNKNNLRIQFFSI